MRTAILVKDYINRKDLDYRFYLTLLTNSTYNSKENSIDYITLNIETIFFGKEELIKKMNISDYTFNRGINNILKSNLIKKNNDLVEVRVKKEGKNFTVINEEEIDILIGLSNNAIKIYLAIKFILAGCNEFKPIKLTSLATMCGLSKGAVSKTIKKIIIELEEKKLIELNLKNTKECINGKFLNTNIYSFKIVRN